MLGAQYARRASPAALMRRPLAAALSRTPVADAARGARNALRSIVVPRQLKAYGDEFFSAQGDRSSHMLGHQVLMRLRNTRSILKTSVTTCFAEMSMPAAVRGALQTLCIAVPSPIQQLAMPPAMLRKDVLMAAPSGSGKTVAFVAPLYANMVKDRDVYGIPVRERRPRAIVLTTSRELIAQTQRVCEVFDAATGMRSIGLAARRRAARKSTTLLSTTRPDVLVMHPNRCLKLVRARRLFIEDLRYVIIDEADALLSMEHQHDAAKLLALVRRRNLDQNHWPVETCVWFATTNITRIVRSYCERLYPNAVSCVAKGAHLPPQQAHIKFMRAAHEREKLDLLLYLLKVNGNTPSDAGSAVDDDESTGPRWSPLPNFKDEELSMSTPSPVTPLLPQRSDAAPAIAAGKEANVEPAIGTSGTTSDALLPARSAPLVRRWLQYHRAANATQPVAIKWDFLRTVAAPFLGSFPRLQFNAGRRTIVFFQNIDKCAALFHQLRKAGHDPAIVHASLPVEVRDKMMRKWAEGHTNILCATDALSRGIDYEVDLVINFDMPVQAATFLNRVGRTARMGRTGRVVTLYTKKQRTVVSVVRALLRRDISLEHVSNWFRHTTKPSHALWRRQKINSVARRHVSLLATKVIPTHLAKTYIRHNAMWRPLYHPRTVGHHGGVPVRQQQKVMDRVMADAIWYRRGVLAKRKGGQAKFGGTRHRGDMNWKGIEGTRGRLAGASGSATPSHDAGTPVGPPLGPPQ